MSVIATLQIRTWKLRVTHPRCHSTSVTRLGSGSRNLALEPCFYPQSYGAKDMNTEICFKSHLRKGHTDLLCHHPHRATWDLNVLGVCQPDTGRGRLAVLWILVSLIHSFLALPSSLF